MSRIVGIDFGMARIGLAISDERKIIASALKTVQAKKSAIETAKEIKQTLSSYTNIEKIVIGLPLLLSGKEGDMAQKVRSFAAILEKELSYPIVFWDERLTSSGVDKMLTGFDVSRKKRAALSDSLSAISILQNYLDSLRF